MDRCIYRTLQLVNTEISEATEGERKNLMDDHLPHRKMGEVELADALIRLLDLGGRYEWGYLGGLYEIDDTLQFDNHFLLSDVRDLYDPGSQHFVATEAVVDLGRAVRKYGTGSDLELRVDTAYTRAINTLLFIGHCCAYDVTGALEEKFQYNKTRADHQRAARDAAGGKKF